MKQRSVTFAVKKTCHAMNKDKAEFIYTCYNVFRLVMFIVVLFAAYIILET